MASECVGMTDNETQEALFIRRDTNTAGLCRIWESMASVFCVTDVFSLGFSAFEAPCC